MNLAGHRDRRLSENYFEPWTGTFGGTPGRLPGALPGCLLDNRDRRILRLLLRLNIAFFLRELCPTMILHLLLHSILLLLQFLMKTLRYHFAVGLLVASLCQCAVLVEDDSDLSPVCQSYAVKRPCCLGWSLT